MYNNALDWNNYNFFGWSVVIPNHIVIFTSLAGLVRPAVHPKHCVELSVWSTCVIRVESTVDIVFNQRQEKHGLSTCLTPLPILPFFPILCRFPPFCSIQTILRATRRISHYTFKPATVNKPRHTMYAWRPAQKHQVMPVYNPVNIQAKYLTILPRVGIVTSRVLLAAINFVLSKISKFT